MASMHGSYRNVDETEPALTLIGEVLNAFRPSECCWYLDRPVSNSGRLRLAWSDWLPSEAGRGRSNWPPTFTRFWPVPSTSSPPPTR